MKKTYADLCIERAEKATPGPWKTQKIHSKTINGRSNILIAEVYANLKTSEETTLNARFIAASRTDVPELARRLEKACEYLRSDAYARSLVEELEAEPEGK